MTGPVVSERVIVDGKPYDVVIELGYPEGLLASVSWEVRLASVSWKVRLAEAASVTVGGNAGKDVKT